MLACAPSLVAHDLRSWRPAGLDALRELKHPERHAVCMGPGFDAADGRTASLVAEILESAACNVLVDGGGLAALGSKEALHALERRAERGLATVITPHGGEAARLQASLGLRADGAPELAHALSCTLGVVAVVKGPDTFIAADGVVTPMREGGPALAKAGTGDVLAGMMSALLAQGAPAAEAAVLAAVLHARAGNEAARAFTPVAVTPEDVIEAIPQALRPLCGTF